jgi:hypothetical protein
MDEVKKISDSNLVADLFYCGFSEHRPPEFDGLQVYFLFKSTPELDAAILRYLSGEARVAPNRYAHQLARVRRTVNGIKFRMAKEGDGK